MSASPDGAEKAGFPVTTTLQTFGNVGSLPMNLPWDRKAGMFLWAALIFAMSGGPEDDLAASTPANDSVNSAKLSEVIRKSYGQITPEVVESAFSIKMSATEIHYGGRKGSYFHYEQGSFKIFLSGSSNDAESKFIFETKGGRLPAQNSSGSHGGGCIKKDFILDFVLAQKFIISGHIKLTNHSDHYDFYGDPLNRISAGFDDNNFLISLIIDHSMMKIPV